LTDGRQYSEGSTLEAMAVRWCLCQPLDFVGPFGELDGNFKMGDSMTLLAVMAFEGHS
jgi:hypothetical protein